MATWTTCWRCTRSGAPRCAPAAATRVRAGLKGGGRGAAGGTAVRHRVGCGSWAGAVAAGSQCSPLAAWSTIAPPHAPTLSRRRCFPLAEEEEESEDEDDEAAEERRRARVRCAGRWQQACRAAPAGPPAAASAACARLCTRPAARSRAVPPPACVALLPCPPQEERKAAAAAKRVQEQLDPEALERHFLLPRDEQIRWGGGGGSSASGAAAGHGAAWGWV